MAVMTKFRAVRNFLRSPGVTVMAGTELELDDREAALLVSLECVDPVEPRDRKRVLSHPNITWEKVAECEPLQPAGYILPSLARH